MPNILTIEIDLDRLHKYGVAKNPTGHTGDLLAETLDNFARNEYGTGTNTSGEHNVWTHNVAHVGTARVTHTSDKDHAQAAPAPDAIRADRDDDPTYAFNLTVTAPDLGTADRALANLIDSIDWSDRDVTVQYSARPDTTIVQSAPTATESGTEQTWNVLRPLGERPHRRRARDPRRGRRHPRRRRRMARRSVGRLRVRHYHGAGPGQRHSRIRGRPGAPRHMFYPNGQCPGCGWGLDDSNGCPNPDCDRDGDKLPADEH